MEDRPSSTIPNRICVIRVKPTLQFDLLRAIRGHCSLVLIVGQSPSAIETREGDEQENDASENVWHWHFMTRRDELQRTRASQDTQETKYKCA